jgi:1-hydroxycarotenoid 3,4-desaturase
MHTPRVAVIGAGVGGLSAALELAARGLAVTVLERSGAPGGKMRAVPVPGHDGPGVDAGPTVFTMRWVFEELFQTAGARLTDHLTLHPMEVLARHAWDGDGGRLDLFADPARSEEAIGAFAGAAEARGYRDFVARSRRIYQAVERPFIRAQRPTPFSLVAGAGPFGMMSLWSISPFETMWRALGDHFRDPRLRQLFGRYATYCGSSPFLAPATLMLIAHVEQDGVWLVDGGMHRVARAMEEVAAAQGATFRYDAEVAEILTQSGRVAGVRLASGERIAAEAVVTNADTAALHGGLFGQPAARAVPAPVGDRSLSAVTWCLSAETEGFPLAHHSVFFSRDYPKEFDALFRDGRVPAEPTVYICAQDRGDAADAAPPAGPERLLVLVNAPALGDRRPLSPSELDACESATFGLLRRCGLTVRRRAEASVLTTPERFERLFPATGGALYGRATHGWAASFSRPGARTTLPGLYLSGGSVHPGAGVPMAAMSGRLAAASLLADLPAARRR